MAVAGATRETTDTCTGAVLASLQKSVYVNGKPWAVLGTPITTHPPCPFPAIHCAANMSEGSATVFAENIKVCRAGDA